MNDFGFYNDAICNMYIEKNFLNKIEKLWYILIRI